MTTHEKNGLSKIQEQNQSYKNLFKSMWQIFFIKTVKTVDCSIRLWDGEFNP